MSVEDDNKARIRAMVLRDRRLARSAHAFFVDTPDGRELLGHLKDLACYDESSFSPATGWNTHHAAVIEGARQQVRVILGLIQAHETNRKQAEDET